MQPTTKWDSKVKRIRKRLSRRKKVALLKRYEVEMQRGGNREKTLRKMAKEIGVCSQRQVERILARAKEYEQQMERHQLCLSATALALASNFESYLDTFGTVFGSTIGDTAYGGWVYEITGGLSVHMREVDRSLALDLLCHLKKEEFPELANTSDWAQLSSNRITNDFVDRFRLKANRGGFLGKCKDCPS